jgi:hypothetical protein
MPEMTTGRLEAFSDGVIAIIVTIMVLELRAPSQPTLAALGNVAPIFVSYALSFLVVAIMWVNHHHLIHAVHQVTTRLLWSNLYLLFWMSLVPFVTDYLGKNYRAADGGGALWLEPRPVCVRVLSVADHLDRAGSSKFRASGVPHFNPTQECFFRSALSAVGPAGVCNDLPFVFYLRPDSSDVLPARKKVDGTARRVSRAKP